MFIHTVRSVLLIQLVILISEASGTDVIIEINNGQILGEESITEENTIFYAFRGMPYAQPPIGDLRFNTSLPAKNWTGTYNATYERSICTSVSNNAVVGSEDCLFLNVYTPKLPSESAENPKLPVIVWIHGGEFLTGSGDLGLHGADRFLNQDVIIVSNNYRLGIFGFISTEDSAIPGNYGLKDQVLALNWVKDNIGYFGGDSNNVTIMGASSGGGAVFYLMQSKLANGLFHKGIAQSGCTLNPWAQAKAPRQLAFRVGLQNGISTDNSTTLKLGLRKVNYMTLQQSTTWPAIRDFYNPLNGFPWAAVIEAESAEAVFTGYSYPTLVAGNFSSVPLLIGYNSLEERAEVTLPWYGLLLLQQYNQYPAKLTPDDMNASPEGKKKAGEIIKKFYFNDTPVYADTDFVNYFSDDQFVRGIVKASELVSKYVQVYLYQLSFTGGVEHEYYNPEGVSHGEELQFLWLSDATVQVTPEAELTSVRMIQMWTNFAKTGNPTPYLDEIVNVTWPVLNATGGLDAHYLNIDTNLTPLINPDESTMTFWDVLYREYGSEPYNTF